MYINLKIYVYIGYLGSSYRIFYFPQEPFPSYTRKLIGAGIRRRSPFEAMLICGALAAERGKWISWIVAEEEDDLHDDDDDGAYNKVTRCNYKAKLSTETEAAYWKTNIVSLYSRPAVKPAITTLSRGGKCESAIVSVSHSTKNVVKAGRGVDTRDWNF